jgi:hypothetical protein
MAIKNTQVQTIPTLIFLAEGQQAVTTIVFCNVTTITNTVTVYAVPFGSNPEPGTMMINAIDLPGGETFALDNERFVLEDNDAMYAKCTTNNAVTVTLSSVSTT